MNYCPDCGKSVSSRHEQVYECANCGQCWMEWKTVFGRRYIKEIN